MTSIFGNPFLHLYSGIRVRTCHPFLEIHFQIFLFFELGVRTWLPFLETYCQILGFFLTGLGPSNALQPSWGPLLCSSAPHLLRPSAPQPGSNKKIHCKVCLKPNNSDTISWFWQKFCDQNWSKA